MTKVDVLLTNAIVVTMDEQYQVFLNGAVAVKDHKIVAVGEADELANQFEDAAEVIDCAGKVLMPGLINVHTHVPMTLLRGLVDDLRLDVWLMGYMMPVEREFVTPEFCRLGTQLACAEMIRSGTTTFADMYYFEDIVAEATKAAGMRAVVGQSVLKFPSPDSNSYEDGLQLAEDLFRKWKGDELIVPAIAPHAPYTCTDEILQQSSALAQQYDLPLHIHLAETASEVENMRKERDMPVIPYVKKQNVFDAHTIAAHCVHIDEGEIHTLEHHGVGVAHNPSSNMKLASGAAPVSRMLDVGVTVGIGTDGTASNNDLDMFEEIRLASFLAKVDTLEPTVLPARQVLTMATRMGAKVLGLEDLTGSLEVGKAADLILVNLDAPHNTPRFLHEKNSIYAQLIYAAKGSDVTDVMIHGQFVMRERELLTLDEKKIMAEAQKMAADIDEFLTAREDSVLLKLIAVGGALEEESFEVQAKIAVEDHAPILQALKKPELEIIYDRHYHEYDTYFSFADPEQGYVRYREDHFVNKRGEVEKVRSRLTLIGPGDEQEIGDRTILSRSRYIAPAMQSFRFYREYFKPEAESEIEKDRLRFLVRFHGTEFYVNLDTMIVPDLGKFLEIKSRTWSQRDAEAKSMMISDLLEYLEAPRLKSQLGDYIQMVENHS